MLLSTIVTTPSDAWRLRNYPTSVADMYAAAQTTTTVVDFRSPRKSLIGLPRPAKNDASKASATQRVGSMPVSNGYRNYIIEQLSAIRELSAKRMFGGVGLYAGEWFFALIDDDVLYFRVDDENRADYESRGMRPFRPYSDRPEVSMSYFQAPIDVVEESEELARWAKRSIEAAQRAAARKAARGTKATTGSAGRKARPA